MRETVPELPCAVQALYARYTSARLRLPRAPRPAPRGAGHPRPAHSGPAFVEACARATVAGRRSLWRHAQEPPPPRGALSGGMRQIGQGVENDAESTAGRRNERHGIWERRQQTAGPGPAARGHAQGTGERHEAPAPAGRRFRDQRGHAGGLGGAAGGRPPGHETGRSAAARPRRASGRLPTEGRRLTPGRTTGADLSAGRWRHGSARAPAAGSRHQRGAAAQAPHAQQERLERRPAPGHATSAEVAGRAEAEGGRAPRTRRDARRTAEGRERLGRLGGGGAPRSR